MKPRVGIDLGTSNSALACWDGTATLVPVPQVTGPGEVSARPLLPSVVLLPSAQEVPAAALRLPWGAPRFAVGEFARTRGAELPHACVTSAKSWLCNPGIDRTAAVLPWFAPGETAPPERISPVNASARVLRHLADAWNDAHDVGLDECEVVLTVPASFDAGARELTLTAAREAAFGEVVLLEEPQAALYAYLGRNDGWRRELAVGDTVLVCDVGGGTTDFALVEVRPDASDQGNVALERIAVGDHILLGGDNMDLMLAHLAASAWEADGKTLDSAQLRSLAMSCRIAKESLLGGAARAEVAVLARGSKLVRGTLRHTFGPDVATQLVEGFFPRCALADAPTPRPRGGLMQMGLPYANDPAITRHLAQLIARAGKMPTHVLYNGGVMASSMLRARLTDVLQTWRGGPVRELASAGFDAAVALGAAQFAAVRGGHGIRIRGGMARSYFIGLESGGPAIPGFAPPVRALCVASAGTEEGTRVELPQTADIGLVVGERATFRFFSSSEKVTPGTLMPAARLDELDPVEQQIDAEAALRTGDVVPVTLVANVTDIGTLEILCQGAARTWKLDYSVRERP